jgi:hypothetical protein
MKDIRRKNSGSDLLEDGHDREAILLRHDGATGHNLTRGPRQSRRTQTSTNNFFSLLNLDHTSTISSASYQDLLVVEALSYQC